MTAEGHKVASLHGAKDASERDAIIDGFRDGKEKVLITTNVIARGIDILQVNMVVNYDLPLMNERDNNGNKGDSRPDIETYIHRIGPCVRLPRRAPELWRSVTREWLLTSVRRRRSHGPVWAQGHLDQLRARQGDLAADGADREADREADHPDRDGRPRRDGGGEFAPILLAPGASAPPDLASAPAAGPLRAACGRG